MNKWWRALLSLLAGVAVLLWRFPSYGLDSDPPHYFNVFNQEISNDNPLIALASGLAVAALVWFLTDLIPGSRRAVPQVTEMRDRS